MQNSDNKPTLDEIKAMKGYTVAKTLALQSKIFNCSLDETWDRHIHKAIHRANDKVEIIHIAEHILNFEKMATVNKVKKPPVFIEGYKYSFNSIYNDKQSRVLVKYTLINPGKYKLEVFRDNQLIYIHKLLLTYPFNQTSLILRQYLKIKRVSFNWEVFKEELKK